MKKVSVLVVVFVLVMVGVVLLLNALHSPVWFRVLVAIGESVLFATVLTNCGSKP